MNLLKLAIKQWDRVAALIFTIVGAVMLISGWVGVSGTAVLAEQAPYVVSGGLGGIFLLGVGATLWISADLRDEWRKLDRIEQSLASGVLRLDTGESVREATEFVPAKPPAAHAVNGARAHAGVASDA